MVYVFPMFGLGGPIWSGEPVSAHLDGWIHRFKSTCDAVKEDRAAEEEKRLLAGPKQ